MSLNWMGRRLNIGAAGSWANLLHCAEPSMTRLRARGSHAVKVNEPLCVGW